MQAIPKAFNFTWMAEAIKHNGVREIKGVGTNLAIAAWLSYLRAWWKDDETPWCGVFVAYCLKTCGYPLPKHWYRALDWLNWGVTITEPCYGCIVVLNRAGGGHVAFCVGVDERGRLLLYGGNQSDAVNVQPFERSRVAGYRMPPGTWSRPSLPIVASNAASSINEA